MRKYFFLLLFVNAFVFFSHAQKTLDSLKRVKDSTLRALYSRDSAKVEGQFAEQEMMEKILSKAEYPLIKNSKMSGIIPVVNPDEIPDPNQDYKLLFELTYNNPDSLSKEINGGLAEIGRVINLHVASGIPVKRIIPVIVVHGAALDAISNNKAYQKKYHCDNPSISILSDLEKLVNAKLIACGQAMAFFGVTKDDLLPEVKVSLTAQTVLSNYRLKGFVLYSIGDVK